MTTTTPYTTVHCNAEYVAHMADEALSNGFKPALDETSGYLLIDEKLIPESFVTRVDTELEYLTIEYGVVLSQEYLFEPDFLDTLDATDREVLMPVVMHLIASGRFPFQIFGTKLEAA